MRDGFGREINYIRLSVTDRCNLRCLYCMPEEGVGKLGHADILSYEQILRICRVLLSLGICHFKVTGGEPLVRRGCVGFVGALRALDGVQSVTLTTNGLLLAGCAARLREMRLDGVNISLDTLDPAAYRRITRLGSVEDVLAGLDAALAAGIPSVKINCVPIRGEQGQDLAAVAALARDRDVQVRFIELMPLGLGAEFQRMDNSEVRALLEKAFGPMAPCTERLGNGPAVYWSLPGFRGKIGFISALGDCFCPTCNRVRLTADGALKTCLHADDGIDLHAALAQPDDGALRELLRTAILGKEERHHFDDGGGEHRAMSQIGG